MLKTLSGIGLILALFSGLLFAAVHDVKMVIFSGIVFGLNLNNYLGE